MVYYLILLSVVVVPSLICWIVIDRTYMKGRDTHSVSDDGTEWYFGVPTWWKSIWKYTAVWTYLTVMTWVFLRAYIPYAAINTSTIGGDNTVTEQYVYCLAYVGVTLGSATAIFWRPTDDHVVWSMTFGYTLLAIIFFWIALDDSDMWSFVGANELLVIIVFIMRFVDGFVCPILLINIDIQYPNTSRSMNQWMSIVGIIGMFLCVWIAYFCIDGYTF